MRLSGLNRSQTGAPGKLETLAVFSAGWGRRRGPPAAQKRRRFPFAAFCSRQTDRWSDRYPMSLWVLI